MSAKTKTTDALEIIRRRFIDNDPEMHAFVEEERCDFEIGHLIYLLRKRAGLSQAELAARIETTQSVISRLEQVDYEGHTYSMLKRVAHALGRRAVVHFPRDVEEAQLLNMFQGIVEELRNKKRWTSEDIAEVLRHKLAT